MVCTYRMYGDNKILILVKKYKSYRRRGLEKLRKRWGNQLEIKRVPYPNICSRRKMSHHEIRLCVALRYTFVSNSVKPFYLVMNEMKHPIMALD